MLWVLTYQEAFPRATSALIWATTNAYTHLLVAWQYWKPDRRPIYRTIRGRTTVCGYRWVWHNPYLTEQNEPGWTLDHTFSLSNLTPLSTIWYYVFSPSGLYDRPEQGPLSHFHLPTVAPWSTPVYVATKQKGVYYTALFVPPGPPQPTWTPINLGLHSLKIHQLAGYKPNPTGTQYLIAGDLETRRLYRRQPPISNAWVPILTDADITPLFPGKHPSMHWIATSTAQPNHLYLLLWFRAPRAPLEYLRSTNLGATWTRTLIDTTNRIYLHGNLVAGHRIHCAVGDTLSNWQAFYTSTNYGTAWLRTLAPTTGPLGPRITVDPTDENTVYPGFSPGTGVPPDLYRQTTTQGPFTQVDGPLHLGAALTMHRGSMWIDPADPNFARVLQNNHIHTTNDYCATWTDHATCPYHVRALAQLPAHPNRLYLGRDINGSPPPPRHAYHVLFVSTNNCLTMEGKSGYHPHLSDGGGDSIPYDCGGLAHDGILLAP